jgi:hypothetical protein
MKKIIFVLFCSGVYSISAFEIPGYTAASGLTVNLGGGFNIATKSEMRTNDTLPSFTNFTGSLNLWFGSLFKIGKGFFDVNTQLGLFAGYVPVMTYKDTTTSKKSSDLKLPVVLDMRFINSKGFFAGVGGGYAHTIITTIDITEATGPAAVVSMLAGWEISLPHGIQAGFTLRAMYFMQKIESSTNSSSLNNSQVNIMPLLQVGYHF